MANLLRLKKIKARSNEAAFPFVVQIAVPDGGFGCTLDAINAWHCYSKSRQRRGQRQRLGGQEYWTWCFEGLEIAKQFRQRFGGEIMPVAIRPCPERRSDATTRLAPAGRFGAGPAER
jgi:hypothetical protein